MTRSSLAIKTLGLGIFLLGSIACGDKPPPVAPDSVPSTEDAGGGGTSMTEPAADAGATTTTTEPTTPPPAPAALALPSAAAKLKFKAGGKAVDLEVKSDGTVSSGGKPAGKIMGMELQGADGKSQLKVDSDGNIMGADGAPYAKFEGDDLSSMAMVKYSIGDDGALTSTNDKGKKDNLGKTEGVGSAKKASLLAAAFAMWGAKPPAAPKGAKPAEKKPADKPATPKPADKPAPKK